MLQSTVDGFEQSKGGKVMRDAMIFICAALF